MPKDACYHKVKARYRVFPSAYASGAIAKCRKVGAANYGTGGKKKKTKKKAMGGVVQMANGGNVKFEEVGTTPKFDKKNIEKAIRKLDMMLESRPPRTKFTVDSKGNVKKNFKNGGNVSKGKVKRPSKNPNIARGCGVVMNNRRKVTKFR